MPPSPEPPNAPFIFDRLELGRGSDAPVLRAPGRASLSFAQLNAAAGCITRALHQSNIGSRDIVALAIPSGIELLTAVLGATRACAVCPIDCSLTEIEFRSRLERLGAAALITGPGEKSSHAAIARSLGIGHLAWTFAANTTPPQIPPTRRSAPEGTAIVLETSGTIGTPKLVPLTHRNVLAMTDSLQRNFGLTASDCLLSIMPLHHLLGIMCALAQLLEGGSVVCIDNLDPCRFPDLLDEFRPTWFAASPTQLQALVRQAEDAPDRFLPNSLRFARCGTAAIAPAALDSFERLLGIPIIYGYGLTEAGAVAHTPVHNRIPGSVGRSVGPTIAIADSTGNLLPPNSEGEVVLSGDSVMSGYLNDPAACSTCFRDGWFRTGDLGWLSSDGNLFITGRIKDAINRGGETIAPLEIDAALNAHPAIHEAAVFAIPHPTLGEDLAAAVTLRSGAAISESELRQFLAGRLSRSRIPTHFWFVDAIPRTATGKPQRGLLCENYLALDASSKELASPPAEPPSTLEEKIAATWQSVLKKRPASPQETFFAAGGDSLAFTALLSSLQDELHLSSDIWGNAAALAEPTVAALARLAQEHQRSHAPLLPARSGDYHVLQSRGSAPPLFCFSAAGIPAAYLGQFAKLLGPDRPFIVFDRCNFSDAPPEAEFNASVDAALAAILALNPTGPCLLAGHCYGGIQAFETALRLSALGRAVPLLVLFDTPTPGYPKPLRHSKAYLRQALRRISTFRLRDALRISREIAGHVSFIYSQSRRKSSAATPAQPAAHDAIAPPRAAAVMMRTYAPRPFPGRIVHFLAADELVRNQVLEDPRLGWRDFANSGFEAFPARGSHHSLFAEGHAAQIAATLRTILVAQVS